MGKNTRGEHRGSRTVFCNRRLPISRASRTVQPEKNEAQRTSAIFGLNVGECYASYDRTRHCLKTCQDYLFPMEGDSSMEFCLTFTSAGMMRNGKLYPLHKPERRTCESGSGWWPTPDTRGFTNRGSLKLLTKNVDNEKEFLGMAYRANGKKKKAIWPTPRSSSGNGAGIHGQGGHNLQTAVSLWPTPRTKGMCGGTGNWKQLIKKTESIEEARKMGAGNGGQLNPDWVEALMGYPQGWTNIDVDAVPAADYPALWRSGEWEKGIPRVVCSAENRTLRLKCLGNAVVPQIPAMLFKLIFNTKTIGEIE